MAASILSGIVKVDKDTKKAFLSIDATLQKMYKLESDKTKREIRARKEEQQAKKTQEKEKNLLEDILGELKKKNKDEKKKKSLVENLFDLLKGPIVAFAGSVAGAIGSIGSAIAPFVLAIAGAAAALKGLADLGNWWKGSRNKPGMAANIDFGKGAGFGQRIREDKEAKNYQRGKPGYRQRSEYDGGKAMQFGLTNAADRDKMRGVYEKLLIDLKNDEAKALEEARPKVSKTTSRGVVQEKGIIDPKTKSKIEKDFEERRRKLEANYIETFGPSGSAEKKQRGGPITVPGTGSGDKIPMMLPPGSFVMNRNASAMLQNGGLVPTLLEPGEKVFGPNEVSPLHHMLNTMIPRFQEGGVVKDTYGKKSEEGILPAPAKTTSDELKLAKLLEKFSGKAMGGEIQPNQKRGLYIEGGREGYDPHFHINRADQANFNRKALDPYVKVNGQPLSSGVTVPGGQYGASRDGGRRRHTGIDFAFGGGKQMSLAGEAEWLSNKSVQGIGDKTSFKTPVGVFEVIHGTYKGNALPGSYDASNIASSGGGGEEAKPQNALDMLTGAVSGLGEVGKAISGIFSSFASIAGSELMSALFGMGPAQAAADPTPTTGPAQSYNGPNKVSKETMIDALTKAGFNKNEIPKMVAIGMAESSGNARAHNPNRATGDNSYGLWQINMIDRLGPERRKQFGIANNEELFNPYVNAKAAKSIRDSQGFGAWSVYKSGKYKEHLQTGGLVNMSGTQSPNTSRFKQAQEEFAQMIADKTGSPIVVMGGGGGQTTPTMISTPNMQSTVPNLPDGPSSIQAAEYFYRLNLGSVL